MAGGINAFKIPANATPNSSSGTTIFISENVSLNHKFISSLENHFTVTIANTAANIIVIRCLTKNPPIKDTLNAGINLGDAVMTISMSNCMAKNITV